MSLHIVKRCAPGAAPMAVAFPALPAAAQTPALPRTRLTVACPNPPSLLQIPLVPRRDAGAHAHSRRRSAG
jgi:hypothetical protein